MSNKNPLERKFTGMRRRCEHSTARSAASYFGRGIRICRLWRKYPRKFRAWAKATGWKPGMELHRIDPLGPYAPWNCVWLTTEAHQALHHSAKLKQALFPGTRESARVRGGKTRLTAADVQYIHAHPEKSAVELGKELGVRRSTIWNVRSGVTWQDLHPALSSYAEQSVGNRKLLKRVAWVNDPTRHLTRDDIRWLYDNPSASYDVMASRLRLSVDYVKAIFAGKLCTEFFIGGNPPKKLRNVARVVTKEVVDFMYEHPATTAEDIAAILGLRPGTVRDIRRGRAGQRFYRGGIPPRYKPDARHNTGVPLSLEDVASIFMARGYMSAAEVANLHGVSKATVYTIWRKCNPKQGIYIQHLEEFIRITRLF